jgi:hypothetical protein
MRSRFKLLLLILLPLHLLLPTLLLAGEGMWLPIFLQQFNEKEMQTMGMKVTAEDIYSVNKSSMKDAVVIFGGGCTGEIISPQGLLLTNHHCGFGQIQSHSTLEKDYLKNGFWAYKQEEELACPGLSVTFIIRMEDVTEAVLKDIPANATEADRQASIKAASVALEKKAMEGTHYEASVKSFYYGNNYYMFVTEKFTDVRMVGAPPSGIGKFGGDTDNWMWPRHTGDFALFRVYAGKDNKPAAYSTENVPFKPRHHFPVSLKGVQPGDFTMVYGFPGRTTQYIPSPAIKTIIEVTDPTRIMIRDKRLEIIDDAMRSSDQLRIQYAAKQASIANAWKKWQGELRGLERLRTLEAKQAEEKVFNSWVAANNKSRYSGLLDRYAAVYKSYTPISRTTDYINEAAYGVELLGYARGFRKLADSTNATFLKEESAKLMKDADAAFKDIDIATDKKLFAAMMGIYYRDVEAGMRPEQLEKLHDKYKGDFIKCADELYAVSNLTSPEKVRAFLKDWNTKKADKLRKDPMYSLSIGFVELYERKLKDELTGLNAQTAVLNREYMAGQMEMQQDKRFYPDANSTLRVAYGNVGGYLPRDGVTYQHLTTLEGIMEKEDPSSEEFEVPAKLKELYSKKDYGQYAVNGKLPVAFVASNHTTGGNSGSPVLNANGELIGTNFDRVWEGTMSDIDFDPAQCRNISVDVRYTLFVIDKYAGCSRLIEEMTIVR